MGLLYQKYLTLDAGSSILSTIGCHFGHTSPLVFLANTGILWTIGHRHATKYGCSHFMMVFGASCALASLIGLMDVMKNNRQVIAGPSAGTAGLVAFNLFSNPTWFNFRHPDPRLLLATMVLYGAFYNDKAVLSGTSVGYLAFLMAL